MRSAVSRALVTASVLLAACGGGTVGDGATGPDPKPDTTTTGNPGTVQRSSITIRVTVDPADVAIATAAGVTTAAVPVRLTRVGGTEAPRTGITGGDGRVTFAGLLEGTYELTVERRLSASELAQLPAGDRDASVLAAGTQLFLSPPVNRALELALVATRRGSLVISEVFPFNMGLETNVGYGFGTYLEVYNNSDTTSYLDGMLLAQTSLTLHYGFSQYPCASVNTAARLDSTGVAVILIHGFPGGGREYPVLPGEAKVIAVDAMDHNAARPDGGQLDLSRAAFEQIGNEADIDNPFVPNMLRVQAGSGIFGRGYPHQVSPVAYVLALPASLSSLTKIQLVATTGASGGGELYDSWVIPRGKVLDILGLDSTPEAIAQSAQRGTLRCDPWLAPAFERAPANLVNTRLRKAISRKSLGRTADGREILQRTRTSARDFEYAEPLRRSLLK